MNDERIARQAELESSFAYEHASGSIDAELLFQCAEDGTEWMDEASAEDSVKGYIAECIEYLTLRGLIARHPTEPTWISVLDESEATS